MKTFPITINMKVQGVSIICTDCDFRRSELHTKNIEMISYHTKRNPDHTIKGTLIFSINDDINQIDIFTISNNILEYNKKYLSTKKDTN